MTSNRIQTALSITAALVVMSLLFIRHSSDAVGCPGGGWDCGSHLAVINALARGDVYPLVKRSLIDPGRHEVLYSGILGSHLFALAISQLGTGIPRAMLMTLDGALALSLVMFYLLQSHSLRRQSLLAWLLFAALFIPGFCYISAQGFFSLAVSVPFVMLAVLLTLRRSLWLGFAACMASCFVYPDSAFWLLPFFCLVALRATCDTSLKGASVAATAIVLSLCAYCLAGDLDKDGAIYLNTTCFFLVPALLLLTFAPTRFSSIAKLKELPDEAVLSLIVFLSISCWSTTSYLTIGSLKYYALKQYLWAPIVCCFMVPYLIKASPARALLALGLALSPLWVFSTSSQTLMGFYAKPRTAFSARDEAKLLRVLQSPPCPDFIVVGDSAGRGFNSGATFFLSANSYSLSVFPDTTIAQLKSGASFDFVRFLESYWSRVGSSSQAYLTPDGVELCVIDMDRS